MTTKNMREGADSNIPASPGTGTFGVTGTRTDALHLEPEAGT